MADKKISSLDKVTTSSSVDEIIINVGGGENATTSRIALGDLAIDGFDPFYIELKGPNPGDVWSRNDNSLWKDVNNGNTIQNWVNESDTITVPASSNAAILTYVYEVMTKFSTPVDKNPYYNNTTRLNWNSKSYLFGKFKATGAYFNQNSSQDTIGFPIRQNLSHNIGTSMLTDNYPTTKQIYSKSHLMEYPLGTTSIPFTFTIDVERTGYTYTQVNQIRVYVLPFVKGSNITFDVGTTSDSPISDLDPFDPNDEINMIAAFAKSELGSLQHLIDGYITEFPGTNDTTTLTGYKHDIYEITGANGVARTPFDESGNRLPSGTFINIAAGDTGLNQVLVSTRALSEEIKVILGVTWPFSTRSVM